MSQPTYTYSGGINNSVASEMMEANSRVRSELDQLNADLQSSLRSWQTPSSKPQYEARQARWNAAADAMPASLAVASDTLSRITSRMNNTETAITDSWS